MRNEDIREALFAGAEEESWSPQPPHCKSELLAPLHFEYCVCIEVTCRHFTVVDGTIHKQISRVKRLTVFLITAIYRNDRSHQASAVLSSISSYRAPNALPGVPVRRSVLNDQSAIAFCAPVLIGSFAPSMLLKATLPGDLPALAGDVLGDMAARGCRFNALELRRTDFADRGPKLNRGCCSVGTLNDCLGFGRLGVGPCCEDVSDSNERLVASSSKSGWLAGRAGVLGG